MKRILFIAYKFFDEDPRIVREVAACLRAGYKVDVICVGRPYGECIKPPYGVTLYSPKIERKRASRLRYIWEYLYFLLYSFFTSTILHLRRKYKIVQVFVMPELLAFSTILPKILGAQILLDWEDPSLEVFQTKYSTKSCSLYEVVIKTIEKVAVSIADVVITPNVGFNKAFEKRGIKTKKFRIVMNAPDSVTFGGHEKSSPRIDPKHYSLLFNGTIFERHGLHVAIRAVAEVRNKIQSVNLYIVGDGESEYKKICKEMVCGLGLEEHVTFIPRLAIDEMPPIIHSSSAGIVPNISTPFTEINLPQRILEFGLLGKPIIIPRLSGILDYINDDEAYFFTPGCEKELACKILELRLKHKKTRRKVEALYEKCRHFDWENSYADTIKAMHNCCERAVV